MKERTQGKAKLHIIRDERRMGRIDKHIAAKNRPGYNPQRERRNLELYSFGPPRRPHAVPCACRFCYCWDMWQEIERKTPADVDTSGNVKPQSPQV